MAAPLVYGGVMGNERGERTGSVAVAIVSTAAVVTAIYATLVAGIYFWVVLSSPNSVGERAGILQRFSAKGWICRTHEGGLVISVVPPDVTPVIWHFSVRDESVLPSLTGALGKRVVLY